MDLPKFVALTISNKMWFATPKGLEREDPFEGFFPPSAKGWFVPQDPVTRGEKVIGPGLDAMAMQYFASPSLAVEARAGFSVNCWHASEIESAAMWRSYGRHDAALAVVTDLQRMRSAFLAAPEVIHCSHVQYVDFQKYFDNFRYGADIVLCKREQFSAENEVRLVCPKSEGFEYGRLVNCSLKDLAVEIWISPTAESWYIAAIEGLCKMAGLNARVIRSPLMNPPPPLISAPGA